MKSLNLIFILLFLSLVACQNSNSGQSADGEEATKQDSVVLEVAEEDQQASIPTGIVFDQDRFPYLEPINDSTTLMHAYTIKMKMTHSYPLAPVTNDQLMWIDAHNSNETMGTFLSYVIEGRRIMLSAVNVRVDYFNKSVKGYSSVDSSIFSSRSYFLADPEKAKVLKEGQVIKTVSGQDMIVEEYYSVRAAQYTPKYIAQAYMDFNDTYIVSVLMTATDEFEFKDALDSYYRLVQSFDAAAP